MEMAKKNQRYTYQDILNWEDGERWELFDGVPIHMGPSPNTRHQRISLNITLIIGPKLSGKTCQLFYAPEDVVFSKTEYAQPDLFIVCDPQKIFENNIQGSPEVIFEILSPYSLSKDKRDKKNLYQKFGVKEYIILDPNHNYAERHRLNNEGRYDAPDVFFEQEILVLTAVENMEIPLWEVFGVKKKAEEA